MPKRNRKDGIYFMVSEQERQLIEEKMKLAGIQNMRAYLLKMAVDGYVIKLDFSDVRELVSLLRNTTNNMNQIAKRANETNHIYEADIKDLQAHYDSLWEKAEGIMRKLADI